MQPAAAASRWRTWLSAFLAMGSLGTLLAPKAAAQNTVRGTAGPVPQAAPSASSAQEPVALAGSPATTPTTNPQTTSPPTSSRNLRGTVRDEATHEPLPGVTVLLKGTTLGTATDKDGSFTLTIPGDAPTVQLGFSFVGYNSVEQTVAVGDSAPLTVILNNDVMVLGGDVVITSGTIHKPWPWHPRRLYYWSKMNVARALGQ